MSAFNVFPTPPGSLSEVVCTDAERTLALADAWKMVSMDNAGANTITIPPHSEVPLPVGVQIALLQAGAGTIAAGAGVTIQSAGDLLSLGGQFHPGGLWQRAPDLWLLTGSLA